MASRSARHRALFTLVTMGAMAGFVACSGDGTSIAPNDEDGGNAEAGASDRKASTDGTTTADSDTEVDASVKDGGKDALSGDAAKESSTDASTEGGGDGASIDAAADAQDDAGLDGAADAADDATSDAGADGGAPVLIQNVQDGTVAKGAKVTLAQKFVTGVRVAGGGSVNYYVQEPQGQTAGAHTYPEYAGMNVFFTSGEATTFAASSIVTGDCITVSGTVAEFPSSVTDVGTTQLATITAMTKSTGCGTAPVPFAVSMSDVASDVDLVTNGNQPGAKAEAYEGVLLQISGVKAPDAVNGARFDVIPTVGSATLEIDNFLYGVDFSYAANTTFTSITGVYSQLNRGTGYSLTVYRLKPRSLADIVQ